MGAGRVAKAHADCTVCGAAVCAACVQSVSYPSTELELAVAWLDDRESLRSYFAAAAATATGGSSLDECLSGTRWSIVGNECFGRDLDVACGLS